MRRAATWVGGMAFATAMIVSCGTSMHGMVTGMAVVLGIDGLAGNGDGNSMIGDAKAMPGDPISCTPLQGFCEGTMNLTCTYSGHDAFGSDCNATATATATNPGTCVTTGCYMGQKACCGHQRNLTEWSFTAPISSSGFTNTGFDGVGGSLYTVPQCGGGIFAQASLSTPSTTACAAATKLTAQAVLQGAGGFTTGQVIILPNANASLYASYTTGGMVTSCSNWTGRITLAGQEPNIKLVINATCSQVGETSFVLAGSIASNR